MPSWSATTPWRSPACSSPKIGGPSVKPYQPEGYWENLNFPQRKYVSRHGRDQYRRGLYTWWQRTFLHPSLLAFDAPSREECAADRSRSNIPQQALVLLNDPTYVEAARAFAARISKRVRGATRRPPDLGLATGLPAHPRLARTTTGAASCSTTSHDRVYRPNPAAADALILKVGVAPTPEGLDPAELAAWTNVARVMLNLHEIITRNVNANEIAIPPQCASSESITAAPFWAARPMGVGAAASAACSIRGCFPLRRRDRPA